MTHTITRRPEIKICLICDDIKIQYALTSGEFSMKIILLSLPGLDENDGNLFPLGLGYLLSSMKQHHDVRAYHFNKMSNARKVIINEVDSFAPDIVGLTCNTFTRGFVREAIQMVRGINKDIKIVVGGVHVSFLYEQALRKYDADVVVIGEGENTLRDICNALEKETPLKQVRGIAYKNEGDVIVTPPREVIASLDSLPMPDYSYARKYIEESGIGVIISSRGCPVRCIFCSTSSYWGQKVRMYSANRVVNEMEMIISEFNVRKIFIHDDTFNLGIERVKAICKEILDRGLKVEWACSCRVVPATEEMIAGMVEAGCRQIVWGIESGSEMMLKSIQKKITLKQIRNAFELSNKFSDILSTGAFIMVGNPGETQATIQESMEFLNSIPMTDELSSSILDVLPGTLLYEELKKEGQIDEDDWVNYITVPPYTLENSFLTLLRWSKQLNRCGDKTPIDPKKHFWNGAQYTLENKGSDIIGSVSKILNPKRAGSRLKKFLGAGRIRF